MQNVENTLSTFKPHFFRISGVKRGEFSGLETGFLNFRENYATIEIQENIIKNVVSEINVF